MVLATFGSRPLELEEEVTRPHSDKYNEHKFASEFLKRLVKEQ